MASIVEGFFRSYAIKAIEQRQAVKVSWFTESKACSEVVIGTVQ